VNFSRSDRPLPEFGHRGDTMLVRHVSPSYFEAMRIPLRSGRWFSALDKPSEVAIISEALARRYFPGEDPLGATIDLLPRGSAGRRVIGIVGDVKNAGLNLPTEPELYRPLAGDEKRMFAIVRTVADPTLTAALRVELRQIDPQMLASIQTMQQQFDTVTARPRFNGVLFGSFAAVALLLAAVGIYGVISFTVARRMQEIGIRMALGADSRRILAMVLREAMLPVAAGIAAGLAGAIAASRFLAGLLYDVTPRDPLTYLVVATLLTAIAMAASLIPSRRAARVDPMQVLRAD
jgi:putative ABC transport system permease protein